MSVTASASESVPKWGRRFSRGDREAFARLYDEFASRVLAYLASRCRGRLSADDVAQEAWVRVWQGRESFDGENFEGWLFAIARNSLVSEYRKKQPDLLSDNFDVAVLPEESNAEELAALEDCRKQVGGDFVEVLNAQIDDRETAEQIAARLGIAVNTVYSRVSRAKQQLRDCMKKKFP